MIVVLTLAVLFQFEFDYLEMVELLCCVHNIAKPPKKSCLESTDCLPVSLVMGVESVLLALDSEAFLTQ